MNTIKNKNSSCSVDFAWKAYGEIGVSLYIKNEYTVNRIHSYNSTSITKSYSSTNARAIGMKKLQDIFG